MKSSNLFWGFFFITFGGLYLIARYSSFVIDWYAIWELWPILIILVGVAIILKGSFFKPLISVLIGILLAFLAFGMINDLFDVFEYHEHRDTRWWDDYSENYYNLNYEERIKHVNLNIEAGAGKFYIEKITDDLLNGYSRGNIGKYNFTNTQNDSVAWVTLAMDDIKSDVFSRSFDNQLKLSLNEKPTYSLDLKIGAAKSFFNLIPFKINNLVLKTGATETKVKLGDKTQTTYVNIEMGAAALEVYIPKNSGCKINGDLILMAKHLPGFSKSESGYYVTSNYHDSDNKVIMNINGAVSSFEVKRY